MSIHGSKKNKGEWAEFYVFLKVLGEGKLYAADEHMKRTSTYLDVLKVIREEVASKVMKYCIDSSSASVKIIHDGTVLVQLPMADFSANADRLLDGMKTRKGRTIEAPTEVCDFAQIIFVEKPKAPAVKSLGKFGGKNDIYIEVRDSATSLVSTMGFSIKSKFAHPPTLFNAGTSSQFLFGVEGCDEKKMDAFNALRGDNGNRGWQTICLDYLRDNGLNLKYEGPKSDKYKCNLELVGGSMDKILACCVYDRLVQHSNDQHGVEETIDRIIKQNPLNYSMPEIFYPKFMKDFLMASFTGMTAGTRWNGKEEVNGGYIVVTEEGDVLCYHSNDREAFRDYLYRNTFFEYVSTDKYKWGYIEKENDKYFLPLNVSIRFSTKSK